MAGCRKNQQSEGMTYRAVLLLLCSPALFASCGGSESSAPKEHPITTATAPAVQSRCEKVPSPLRASLADSLKKGRKLGASGAVRSDDDFSSAPPGLSQGHVYFVTADVRPNPGLSTWAVSEDSFKGQSGMILGVDAAARAVSDLGADIPRATLDAWGVTGSADGFSESQDCVG